MSRGKEKTIKEIKEAISVARSNLVVRSQPELGLPKGVTPVSEAKYVIARNAFDTIVQDPSILDALADGFRGIVTTHKKHGKI